MENKEKEDQVIFSSQYSAQIQIQNNLKLLQNINGSNKVIEPVFIHSNEHSSQSLKKNDQLPQIQENNENNDNSEEERTHNFTHSLFENNFFHITNLFFLVIFLLTIICYGSTKDQSLLLSCKIIEGICQGFFLIRLILKIITIQVNQIPYVILDFITIVSSFIGYYVDDQDVAKYFLSLRVLKLIFFIKEVSFLNEEIRIFSKSFKKASYILAPAICLVYVYTIVGLYSFHNLQYNRCRDPANIQKKANWTVYEDEVFLCGQKSCPVVNGIQYKCLNPISYEVEPNPDELMTIEQGYGLMNYQNIGTSFFSTFKQTLLTGSSRSIILYKQAMNDYYVLTYFYSFIYFMQVFVKSRTYIYLNIFYGVIITGLQDSRKKSTKEIKPCPRYSIDFGNENAEPMKNIPRISFFQNVKNKNKDHSQSSKSGNNSSNVEEGSSQSSKNKKQAKKSIGKTLKILKIFNIFITALTTLNLALDFEGQSQNFRFIVDCIDFAFFTLAVLHLVITIILERKQEGELKKTTIMDIIIMIVCFAGVIYEGAIASSFTEFLSAETAAAKVLRTFKYLRVMLIVFDKDVWPEGHKLIVCIYEAVLELRKIILIWLIVMLTLAMAGFHLHAGNTLVNEKGELDLDKGKPHQISFATPYHAFIFTILAIYDEEWDYLMFQQYVGSGMIIVVWMLFTMMVGYIVFSRYLTCLLSQKLEIVIKNYEEENPEVENEDSEEEKSLSSIRDINQIISNKIAPIRSEDEESDISGQHSFQQRCEKCKKFLMVICDSKPFKFVKLLFIIVVGFTLFLDMPNKELTSEEKNVLFSLNTLTFIFFLFETIAKIGFYGFIRDRQSYLRRSYLNLLNLLILIVELLYLTPLSSFFVMHRISKIKALRALFIIELRYQSEWEMRILIRSLKQLFIKFLQLLLITFIIYFYFALVLTKVYQDDGYYCDNVPESATVTTKQDCFNWGGDWVKHQINFCHVFSSLLSLFFIGSMEGWVYSMQKMMNFNGGGNAPSYNANEHIQIFFVVFFFIGNIIILNSFISLTLITFKKIKQKETGQKFLNQIEKMWLRLKLQIIELTPLKKVQPPKNCFRNIFYKVCTHKGYTIFKAVMFSLYLLVVSFYHSNMSNEKQVVLEQIVQTFLIIMLGEYAFEKLAFGWNISNKKEFIFETIACVYVFVYIGIQRVYLHLQSQNKIHRIFGGLLIIFQVLRYLKLLDQIPFAQKVLKTILSILPKTANLFLLIVVILFLYSVTGIQLFSFLKHNTEIDSFNQNYQTFATTIFALIKFSTMENPIEQIKNAAQTLQPNFICHEITNYEEFLQYGQNGCGSPAASYIFFLSFHLFYSMLLMSTFIAIIVDAYADIKNEENSQITVDVLDKVVKEWVEFDPEASGYISYEDFWKFSGKMINIYMEKGSKEEKKEKEEKEKMMGKWDILQCQSRDQFLRKLDLGLYQIEENKYHFKFQDVIESLTKLYLSKKMKYEIRQKKVHKKFTIVGNHKIERNKFNSQNVPEFLFMKAALREWKKILVKKTSKLKIEDIESFSEND